MTLKSKFKAIAIWEILLVENWYLKWTRSWTKFQNTGTSNLSAAGENSLKYIPETEKIVLRKKPVFPSNLMSLLLRSVQCSLRNERVESESNILYFNLSSCKRFRPRRNVVVCLIPLGLRKRKPALGEGCINFNCHNCVAYFHVFCENIYYLLGQI